MKPPPPATTMRSFFWSIDITSSFAVIRADSAAERRGIQAKQALNDPGDLAH
jgi:hypothetical protein